MMRNGMAKKCCFVATICGNGGAAESVPCGFSVPVGAPAATCDRDGPAPVLGETDRPTGPEG